MWILGKISQEKRKVISLFLVPFTSNVNFKYMDMYPVPEHGRTSVQLLFLLAFLADVMRFKILSGWSMSKSRITTLGFRRAD